MKLSAPIAALVFTATAFAAATVAVAQSTTLTPPTLEGTIKVYPAPKVQPQPQAPAAAASADCVCTTQYDPVCARLGEGGWTTYSNACVARCAGATEIRHGPC